MGLDLRPGGPGVARRRRALELGSDGKPRAARSTDEVTSDASTVCGRVPEHVADVPLRFGVGVRARSGKRETSLEIADVGLDTVHSRILAVVDFGEAVGAEERELKFLPDVVIDGSIPAPWTKGCLPPEFEVGEIVGVVRPDIAPPVDSPRPEPSRPGSVEHQTLLRLPLEVQPVNEAATLGVFGNDRPVLEYS